MYSKLLASAGWLVAFSSALTLYGCVVSSTSSAFSQGAFGAADTATVELATGVDDGTRFSAFALDECPNATLKQMAYVTAHDQTASVTIPAGKKFYLIVTNPSCPVAAGFVPVKDGHYRIQYLYPRGPVACKLEITQIRTSSDGTVTSPEPTFDGFTRINVYGLTPKGMCPQLPK